MEVCEGKITRRRIAQKKKEEAILDFFIVCDKIATFVEKLIIDEEKQFPLTRYTEKGGKHSDHNTMILDLNINYWLKKPKRIELFNFKDLECQKMFRDKTENSTLLSKCFQSGACGDVEMKCNNWFKILKSYFYECFNKIRCKKIFKSRNPVVILMKQRSELIQKIKMNNDDQIEILKLKLGEIELKLSNMVAEENRKQVFDNFEKLSNTDGTTNINGIWTLKRKIFPKITESLPIAKKDSNGRLISSQKELMQLYLDTYKHRLRQRPIKGDYIKLKHLKEELYTKRLKIAMNRKSEPWKIEQLKKVLNGLKTGKS